MAMASDDDDDDHHHQTHASASAATTTTTTKSPNPNKLPPRNWSPSETFHLINAYQEKWEQLKRGLLRASHWDDVARSLASRSAPSSSPKSSVQCRHKLEKLRRRYRSERRLSRPSLWPFFERMDLLERGPEALRSAAPAPAPAPAAASPLSDIDRRRPRLRSGHIAPSPRNTEDDDDDEGEEEDDDEDQPPPLKIRSLKRVRGDDERYRYFHNNGYSSRDGMASSHGTADAFNPPTGAAAVPGVSKKAASSPYGELASVIRSLGEGLLHMEQLKIQMHREAERLRADMEARRTVMVLESQRQIADLFSEALGTSGSNTKKKEKKKTTMTMTRKKKGDSDEDAA